MSRCIFAFPSVTIALKAQKAFKEAGLKSDVIRTPKNLSSGCGYSTAVYGELGEASGILEKNGITPKAVSRR